MDILLSILFQSIPESYITLLFAINLIQPSLSRQWKKILLFSVLISILSYVLRVFEFKLEFIIPTLFFILVIGIKYLFHLNWFYSFTIIGAKQIVQMSCEVLIVFALSKFSFITYSEVIDSPLYKSLISYTYLIPILFLAMLIKKKQLHKTIQKWLNFKYKWIFPLILAQCIIGLIIHALFYVQSDSYYSFLIRFPILTIGMIGVTIVMFLYLKNVHKLEIMRSIEYAEKPFVQELEQLIQQYRRHKHDFHNHIEVLQTLLQENEYEEAQRYMASFHKSVIETQQRFPFKQHSIQALLNAKLLQATERNIQLKVFSDETFLYPHMKSYDVTILLGNLLDNAIEALNQKAEHDEKWILIEYTNVMNILVLTIANNGPAIPKSENEKIFEQGYTSKSSVDAGNGLAIVKNIVEHYDGEITITSDNEKTQFQVAFPIN